MMINRTQVQSKLVNKQSKFKTYYDNKAKKQPAFSVNQNVTFKKGGLWEPAKIVGICKEPRSYLLKDNKGQVLRRNSSQIRQSSIESNLTPTSDCISDCEEEGSENDQVANIVPDVSDVNDDLNVNESDDSEESETYVDAESGNNQNDERVRPQRNTRQPSRFKDFITYFK